MCQEQSNLDDIERCEKREEGLEEQLMHMQREIEEKRSRILSLQRDLWRWTKLGYALSKLVQRIYVKQLQAALRAAGAPVTGLKYELIRRITWIYYHEAENPRGVAGVERYFPTEFGFENVPEAVLVV